MNKNNLWNEQENDAIWACLKEEMTCWEIAKKLSPVISRSKRAIETKARAIRKENPYLEYRRQNYFKQRRDDGKVKTNT